MDASARTAERRMIMPKKQNKPTKTCSDCIHESACRGWTGGRYISDDSASRCPNHQTVKESGAYLCGVLDERKRKKSNADRIRAMSDEELAVWIVEKTEYQESVFTYPTYLNFLTESDDTKEGAIKGTVDWLQQPVVEDDNG